MKNIVLALSIIATATTASADERDVKFLNEVFLHPIYSGVENSPESGMYNRIITAERESLGEDNFYFFGEMKQNAWGMKHYVAWDSEYSEHNCFMPVSDEFFAASEEQKQLEMLEFENGFSTCDEFPAVTYFEETGVSVESTNTTADIDNQVVHNILKEGEQIVESVRTLMFYPKPNSSVEVFYASYSLSSNEVIFVEIEANSGKIIAASRITVGKEVAFFVSDEFERITLKIEKM